MVRCRKCDAPVPLDPAKIAVRAAWAELRCTACGVAVPVRRVDAYRKAVTRMTAEDASSTGEPKRAGGRFRWRRGR